MDNEPEQPTPDSDILWAELLDLMKTPEMAEYEAAFEACIAAKNNNGFKNIQKRICERADLHLDIAPQVREFRFAIRDQALAATRMAKALHALSEKTAKLLSQE